MGITGATGLGRKRMVRFSAVDDGHLAASSLRLAGLRGGFPLGSVESHGLPLIFENFVELNGGTLTREAAVEALAGYASYLPG